MNLSFINILWKSLYFCKHDWDKLGQTWPSGAKFSKTQSNGGKQVKIVKKQGSRKAKLCKMGTSGVKHGQIVLKGAKGAAQT